MKTTLPDKCPVCGTAIKLLLTSWYCPRDCDKPKVKSETKYDSEPTGTRPTGGWTIVHVPGASPGNLKSSPAVNVAQYTCLCCANKTWYYIDAVANGQTCPQDGKLYQVPSSSKYMP